MLATGPLNSLRIVTMVLLPIVQLKVPLCLLSRKGSASTVTSLGTLVKIVLLKRGNLVLSRSMRWKKEMTLSQNPARKTS